MIYDQFANLKFNSVNALLSPCLVPHPNGQGYEIK